MHAFSNDVETIESTPANFDDVFDLAHLVKLRAYVREASV